MRCEREATELFNKIRAYVKRRDSFQGADLLCRIGHPEDYPNKCPVRNKIQEESLELENELLEVIRRFNKCLVE